MTDLLAEVGLRPFLIAACLVVGFLILELVLVTFGLSNLADFDGPDIEAGGVESDLSGLSASDLAVQLDIDAVTAAQIETELNAHAGGSAYHLPEVTSPSAGSSTALRTALDLLGLRRLPLSLSLALFSATFAAAGLFPQVLLHELVGVMLPLSLIVPAAVVAAAVTTRTLARFVARIIPRDESSAISERNLGRRRGRVVVGTARAGSPAQVRVTDGYNNSHYIMVEPLSTDDEIPEGSEVLVLRLPGGGLRLVQIG